MDHACVYPGYQGVHVAVVHWVIGNPMQLIMWVVKSAIAVLQDQNLQNVIRFD